MLNARDLGHGIEIKTVEFVQSQQYASSTEHLSLYEFQCLLSVQSSMDMNKRGRTSGPCRYDFVVYQQYDRLLPHIRLFSSMAVDSNGVDGLTT